MISCVIPTKNRAALVEKLLVSLTQQKEEGVEIVVIDNDDGQDTVNRVRIFCGEVRYVRTGGLSMIDNWNRAFSEASEDYVLLIEDKMTLRPGALKVISKSLKQHRPDLLTWRVATEKQCSGDNVDLSTISCVKYSSEHVISEALAGNWKGFNRHAPKGLNCAVRREVINRIEKELSRPICRAVCPDYTLAITLLQKCSEVFYLDAILYKIGENAPSQGRDTLTKKDPPSTVAQKIGCKEEDLWSEVPVKYLSVNNVIYNDLICCLREQGAYREEDVCWKSYFLELIDELELMMCTGVDVSRERLLLVAALRERRGAFRVQLLMAVFNDVAWQAKNLRLSDRSLSRILNRISFLFV